MKKYIMINRFGQSFVIFPYDRKTYFIFDSHKSEIMKVDYTNIINYILQDPSSYNFIICVEGYMTENKTRQNIILSFYDDLNDLDEIAIRA